ncbi:MAG: DUF4097 family beta strand repeat protein [Acidobacteriaceae bacterium]|nr:DUF4097 family beta strand repeat protein [Acidobacteriaceae bacterium]
MTRRASITGPLALIAIGVLFLIHAVSPSFHIGELLAHYWPLLLIVWGVVQLIEVSIRTVAGGPIPLNGISGGGWLVVLLICIAGLISYEVRRSGEWWRQATWSRGVEAFGEQHDYSIATIQRAVGSTPHIVIESFRGDAKIVGTDADQLTINGHKMVRAFEAGEADRANTKTTVEVAVQGSTVVIRCHQDQADSRTPVTTDLDISLPKGASLEVTGQTGDFDISGIAGDVDLSSENAEVRMQDMHGSVKIDTRRSNLIRCTNIRGNVDLRGHGSDIELTQVAGQVTVNGDYTGTVMLHDLAKPVRVENLRTELDAQQVPGEIRLDRGNLNVQNVIGPLHLTTRSTDVTLDGFSNGVEMSVDKGDINLRPGRLPLAKIVVHTRSGNIELALPQAATFALTASTDHGEIENEFGEALKERSEGPGARLEGNVGSGPDVNLSTGRGSITVRKAPADTVTKAAAW